MNCPFCNKELSGDDPKVLKANIKIESPVKTYDLNYDAEQDDGPIHVDCLVTQIMAKSLKM